MYERDPIPCMKQLAIRLPVDTIHAIDDAVARIVARQRKAHRWYRTQTRSDFIRDAIDRRLADVGRKR